MHMMRKGQIEKVEPVRCGGFQGHLRGSGFPT